MPITVTNSSTKPVRSAGVNFAPGANTFEDGELSHAQLAQLEPVTELSLKHTQKQAPAAKPAKEPKQ
ncbi:hypothetical protein KUL42_09840 [Alteromonas sp. KUL42]|uniref:HI1506-related protein n=1 Tax=Alteromonas sp. KUL42 TaxID=2480797 RepID=UPI0010359D64|nr:HI1506-related protein [Alteromonas sp. KUL42]TAP37773.1 hypothetical protein EYR97_04890 [Alteromonas sp. KUL42]GEA06223.1 hypothetical protein KUL42_09840 [Alteromonas sp. KUL42]